MAVADSLLDAYRRADAAGKLQAAQQVVDYCLNEDLLDGPSPRLISTLPTDSLSMNVYYAAERFYYHNAYFKECLNYIGQALPLAQQGHNRRLLATLLCDRTYCLFKQGLLTEAATAGQQALDFCKQHHEDLQTARAYLYLAIVNYGIPQIDQAKLFVQKAIDTDRRIGSNRNTHNILGIACEIYSFAKETDRAISYGQQAVEAARSIGYDEGVVNHLSQLSYAYNRQGDYQRGLATAQQAVSAVEKMDVPDRNLLAISLEYVAYNLLDMKRNSEAVPVLLRAIDLQREVGNTRSVCYDHKALAEAYEPDEPQKAVDALRVYEHLADSIHNAGLAQALGEANAKMHNDELQQQNSQLMQLYVSSKQQKRIIFFVWVAVIMLLTVVIVYLQRLVKKKRNTSPSFVEVADEQVINNRITEQLSAFNTETVTSTSTSTSSPSPLPTHPSPLTASPSPSSVDDDLQFLDQLHHLVLDNIRSSHTDVAHLAPLMAMSKTHLRRKISAVTGQSAAKYIMSLRIEEAKRQLARYPEVTIAEVAYDTGFADSTHFIRVFRRYTDMTPAQYAKTLSA